MSETTTTHTAPSRMRGVPIERIPHLDTRLVHEVIDFLRANNGPDEKGRGHHTKTVNLPLAGVEAAMDILVKLNELLSDLVEVRAGRSITMQDTELARAGSQSRIWDDQAQALTDTLTHLGSLRKRGKICPVVSLSK